MAKFRYVVINAENNQLQGTISAPDEKTARSELNELGFSIITIETINEEAADQDKSVLPAWEFGGTDKNNKNVAGTIQAENRYSAYQRLITEYEFDVEYVIDNTLPEDKKEKERQKGAYDLSEQYSREYSVKNKETADEKDLKEFAETQIALQQQIDFVLAKVKKLLDTYETVMSPEIKEKIRIKVEKILRIKNSTNLDYIRKNAQELLKLLQKEEIFLEKGIHTKERAEMLVEAKSMMLQLRSTKSKGNMDIMDIFRNWHQKNMTVQEDSLPFYSRFLYSIAKFFLSIRPENEEIIRIKSEIALVHTQMKQYLTLYFQATSPEYKTQTKNGLKKLWNKRKILKKELKEEKKRFSDSKKAAGEEAPSEKFIAELTSFCGWLLTFYLIYYFISLYLVSKDFGLENIPNIFYIYRSEFLKYFLSTLFLLYTGLIIKKTFFPKNNKAGLVITPLFLISILLIYFNF